jgi:hypothetical protein
VREALADYQDIIPTLLRDHAVIYPDGQSFIDFADNGPHQRGGIPLSPSFILRYFEEHAEEMKLVTRNFVDEDEVDAHLLLEAKLREIHRSTPTLTRPIADIYFRPSAGQGDPERFRLLAQKGSAEAQTLIANHGLTVTLLALWFWQQGFDLYAAQASSRTRRKRHRREAHHEGFYERYKELIDEDKFNMTSGEALRTMGGEVGLSSSHLRRIMRTRREIHGDPPAPMGRPKKRRRKVTRVAQK